MKTSIPKLHSIKWKDGIWAENIERLDNWEDNGIKVSDVFKHAFASDLKEIVIIGRRENGNGYVDWSGSSVADAAYLLARAHLILTKNGK